MASTNTKGTEVHKRCSWCATFLSPNNRQPDILTLEHDLLNNSLKSKLVLTSVSCLFAFINFFFFLVLLFSATLPLLVISGQTQSKKAKSGMTKWFWNTLVQ